MLVLFLGRVGIYIELEDAVPVDPHEYGSHVYFLRDTEEKLNTAIRQVELSKIKGSFERCCLLNDVIFEEYHDSKRLFSCLFLMFVLIFP